ncbi:MAG: hypothetical protein HQK51_11485, partial [Oligoflexia bacterium]|nr:hypothetical protein [Oligoflexia bacterium]
MSLIRDEIDFKSSIINVKSKNLLEGIFANLGIKFSLKTSIIAAFLLVSFLGLLILGSISYYVSLSTLKKSINDNLLAIHQSKKIEINKIFEAQINDLKSMSISKFIQDATVAYESIAFGLGLDITQDVAFDNKAYWDIND